MAKIYVQCEFKFWWGTTIYTCYYDMICSYGKGKLQNDGEKEMLIQCHT